jgi:uncharacterized membrane protein
MGSNSYPDITALVCSLKMKEFLSVRRFESHLRHKLMYFSSLLILFWFLKLADPDVESSDLGGGGGFIQLTKPVSQQLVLVPSPVWTPDQVFAFYDFYVVKSIGHHPCSFCFLRLCLLLLLLVFFYRC